MYCSKEEIERKRQEAKQKLAQKMSKNDPSKQENPFETTMHISASTSPRFKITGNTIHRKPYDKPQQLFQDKSNPSPKPIPSTTFFGVDKVIKAKLELTSENMFTVILSSFSTHVIDIFKTMPSKFYDTKTKNWSFNVKDYDLLVQKLRALQPNLVVEELPSFVRKLLKEQPVSVEVDYSKLDPELATTLLPFQVDGLRFGISKNGRCLIADDMGLGKTFQALAIANYYKQDWPLLIVTTATMRNVWEETVLKYLPSVSIMHVQYMTTTKDYIGDAKILIISHDLMSRSLTKLLDKSFGAIIIDESHILKNYKTKVTQAATELSKRAKRVILLSGTPALSRPSELYSQLSLVDNSFFHGFHVYSSRYCDAQKTAFGWNASGKSNLKELEIVLNRKFMIRRTKQDVIASLPNKKQEIVNLDLRLDNANEEDRLCLNALAEKYNSQTNSMQKHSILLTYFAETGKIKIPSVCSYILNILESKQKFLVFAHHQVMLSAIEDIVNKKNIKYIKIDGTTSSESRKYFMDKFQTDPEYKCAILSITAANAGITLTAASLVLFAELHWNPSILSQAEARAHRIGQENTVISRYLLAKNTSDDVIWPMIQEKQKILKEAGLSSDSLDDIKVTNPIPEVSKQNNLTSADTMDIATYFTEETRPEEEKPVTISSTSEEEFLFDDEFDSLLSNIDI